ncbi:MAG: deoxyribonuclease V [Desulfobacteraceae bacterium]|jgi:deoxyribonuclease V
MRIKLLHSWNVSPKEAREIQNRIRPLVRVDGGPGDVRHIAGVDVSYDRVSGRQWAGVVVLAVPSLEPVEERWASTPIAFPYVPGLLSFREIPALMDPLEALEIEPDVVFCDGQGIAHPKGLGLAAHLGVLIGKPTIGCAKSRLVGEYAPVAERRGSTSPLRYRGRIVGAVVRTRTGVNPMFISPGFGLDLDTAIRLVLEYGGSYRVPTPTRLADRLVNRARRGEEGG